MNKSSVSRSKSANPLPPPHEKQELVETYRKKLVEKACEQDKEALEAYSETGKAPDLPTLKKFIREGTLSFNFVPVLCGTAFKNKGVQPLLDAVCDYLPSPLDLPPTKGKNPENEEEELIRKASPDEKLGWEWEGESHEWWRCVIIRLKLVK